MPKKATNASCSRARYWQRRVRAKGFRRALTSAVAREIEGLAGERVKDVLDPALIRAIIAEWDVRLVDREVVAALLIQLNRQVIARLERQRESATALLDRQLVADIDALFTGDATFSRGAQELIERIMRQEFVRQLLTDVAFTAIVSFNQRVNPFFGAFTMRALEEQIKGFIRLFMPALQRQAIAFAVSRDNQRIALELARSIVRQLLDQPLRQYVMAAPGQRKKTEALIKKAVTNARLTALIREATLAVWDDLYKRIRDDQVGALLRLDAHGGWLAERVVDALLPLLARPHIIEFIAAEMSAAAAALAPRALLK